MQKKTVFILQDTKEANEELKKKFSETEDYEVVGDTCDGISAINMVEAGVSRNRTRPFGVRRIERGRKGKGVKSSHEDNSIERIAPRRNSGTVGRSGSRLLHGKAV